MRDAQHSLEDGSGGSQGETPRHEIERMVMRLNDWFTENHHRVPRCFAWKRFRRERHTPVFRAVRTTALRGWTAADLGRLYRVARAEARSVEDGLEIPVELLVADKSVGGKFLNARELMDSARGVFADRHLCGRLSPRLWWFWLHYDALVEEMESYVSGIRMRVDAATPVEHNQRRVFEEFTAPLVNGQETAFGSGCFFVLEYAEPQGARAHWRYSVIRDGEPLVASQVLQPRPIYHEDRLLAVIKRVSDTSVTLSVLTSEG